MGSGSSVDIENKRGPKIDPWGTPCKGSELGEAYIKRNLSKQSSTELFMSFEKSYMPTFFSRQSITMVSRIKHKGKMKTYVNLRIARVSFKELIIGNMCYYN